jgi:hypothetical protein
MEKMNPRGSELSTKALSPSPVIMRTGAGVSNAEIENDDNYK